MWNKKGKLFSQAVLCFIIGSVRSYPYCTELASGDCQERPRIHGGGCCCRRLNCFGIFNGYITVECFPMWLSSFYGLAVYFSLFLTVNSPMAYSLTFNLLALLCTPPHEGGLRVVYCQFLFTFQVCTTRFNNKNEFFGHLSVLWKVRGRDGLSSLVSGAEAAGLPFGQGVELLRHFPVTA